MKIYLERGSHAGTIVDIGKLNGLYVRVFHRTEKGKVEVYHWTGTKHDRMPVYRFYPPRVEGLLVL